MRITNTARFETGTTTIRFEEHRDNRGEHRYVAMDSAGFTVARDDNPLGGFAAFIGDTIETAMTTGGTK